MNLHVDIEYVKKHKILTAKKSWKKLKKRVDLLEYMLYYNWAVADEDKIKQT